VEQEVGQLGLEHVGVFGGREVAALTPPRRGRLGDPVEELSDRVLALRASQGSAEVLLRDHVRRQLRPELRHFDVALLERDLPAA
jgi:hypothetical protein